MPGTASTISHIVVQCTVCVELASYSNSRVVIAGGGGGGEDYREGGEGVQTTQRGVCGGVCLCLKE
eukprot:COSAG02_NODE_2100_length_9827_cov_18.167352_14_plen_65_part_01